MKIEEKYFKRASIAIIILIGIIMTLHVTLKPVIQYGEIDSYMLPTISFEQRMSLFVNQSDIDKARVDFPDVYKNVNTFNDLRASKLVVVGENKWISYYFPTYSIAAVPMKLFLRTLGVNQSYTHLLTNILFYLLALLIVYKKLMVSEKRKFFTILLLVCNPIIYYTEVWSSAESFMFSLVVMSLVFFSSKDYKKAAILVSLAGSLNPTIMVYGAMIVVSYFVDIYNNNNERCGVIDLIKKRVIDIMLFGFCFIPSIIPFIFNFITIGKINPTMVMGSSSGIWERAFAYLFDLNLGFLPFAPIILIMFIVLIIIGIYKKNIQSIVYFISLFGTVLAYSVASHINCGMTCISRYNSWSLPIMVFFITTVGYTFIKKELLKSAFSVLIYLSALISISVLIIFYRTPNGTNYVYNNPIASAVLNNVPQLYNPFYATFISRTEHIDGGYTYTKPVLYTDDHGNIRKIMVTSDTISELMDMVKGDNESLEIFKKKVNQIKDKNGYNYINIPKYSDCNLFIKDEEDRGEFIEDVNLFNKDEITIQSLNNNDFVLNIPVNIESNTIYKIEFESDSPKNIGSVFVDLYGNNGAYDNAEQEKHLYVPKGKNKYKIFLDSGNYENIQNGYLRIVYPENMPIKLNNIHVAKMKKANNNIGKQ